MRSFGDKLDVALKERRFDGSHGILIFDFLRILIREANLAGMSEAQFYLTIHRKLRTSVHDHCAAVRDCPSAEEGGVTSWLEAFQYLLRSCATPQAISDVRSKLRTLRQGCAEDERDYPDRVNQEFRRGRGVRNMEDRISIYIYGLMPAI